jgi:hypothetical protein
MKERTSGPDAGAEAREPGLKEDAIGFVDGLIIGIASTVDADVAAGRKLGVAAVPEEAV